DYGLQTTSGSKFNVVVTSGNAVRPKELVNAVPPLKKFPNRMKKRTGLVCLLAVMCLSSSRVDAAIHDRIARNIERTSSFAVRGNVHPMAQAAYEHGKVGKLFRMERITMTFK